MRELMSPKEHFLAGLNPDNKNHFPNAFHGRSRQEMEETNFAGELGKLCEDKVLKIWSGTLKIESESKREIKKAYELIKSDIKTRYNKTLNTAEMLEIAEGVAGYKNIFDDDWRFSIKFNNPVFEALLKSLDKTLGTELVASFERAASNYDVINSKTEYLVNTALVLARETVTPTFQPRGKSDNSALFLPGKLIPNVEYKFGGIIAGQFDGILVPTKYPGEEMDLLDYLENKQSWGVLEIKVPFRPRYISGERKIKKPFSWDVDQFRHRLGKLMVWWDKGHNTPFPLPSAVTFCYLRGVLPPVMHIQSINYQFLKDWGNRVDYSITPSGPNGEEIEEKESMQIQRLLTEIPYELRLPLFAAVELAGKIEEEKRTEHFPFKSISGTQLSFNGKDPGAS